jgi:exodeoxyribonuclease VII large subunit
MSGDLFGPAPTLSGSARKIYTVRELVAELRADLEAEFGDVWLEGEISNYRLPASGHAYFTLKDKDAQIAAVMFRHYGQVLKFKPADGLEVIVHGKVTVYEPRGGLQISVISMEPKGFGALQLAFEQLKARLLAEGLFDESAKKRIPVLARRIGIVTSPTGAALKDILRVLRRRHFNVEILIAPVRVQGAEAAPEIVEALGTLDTAFDLDVIILTRGGGSLEDLWPFNEESVARAVYRCRTPVISAVGHEIDYTIADFVADLRAPTPSSAAEMVIARKADLDARIESSEKRLVLMVSQFLKGRRLAFERVASSPAFIGAKVFVEREQQRIDEMSLRMGSALAGRVMSLKSRLEAAGRALEPSRLLAVALSLRQKLFARENAGREAVLRTLAGCRERFGAAAARLDTLSPLAVLLRGYSICRKQVDGKWTILRSAGAVSVGDEVSVQLSEGSLTCGVKSRETPGREAK